MRVRFYGLVHEAVGVREWVLAQEVGFTINDLLLVLVEKHPALGKLVYDEDGVFRGYLEVAVNRTDIINLDGLETVLDDGDLVLIMPPIGGG